MIDIRAIDWKLWLKRYDQPPFFNSFWLQVEGAQMRERIGGGFTKQLCLRDGDESWWIRSASDFVTLRSGVRAFVARSSHEELEGIFAQAAQEQMRADELVERARLWKDDESLALFDEVVAKIDAILLYTTSIPYFFLDMLEHANGEELAHSVFVKMESEALRARSSYRALKSAVLDRIVAACAARFGLSGAQAASLTREEMSEVLCVGRCTVVASELDAREHCVYWNFGEDTVFSFDPAIIAHMHSFAESTTVEVNEVRGTVAFRGVVRGRVRILSAEVDMQRVVEGDILVAHSTNPAILPAMIRAAAFVTDEGGTASHAAIVAREMKKPCIVGTRMATQVFKDGDMVEVDADNGVVRVLS